MMSASIDFWQQGNEEGRRSEAEGELRSHARSDVEMLGRDLTLTMVVEF